MKTIEYYCGNEFDARCGQELTASSWLNRKILHGRQLLQELTQVDYEIRDWIRIKRVSNAIEDWKHQLDEIFGIETEIE